MLLVSRSYLPLLVHILYTDFRWFKVNLMVLILLFGASFTRMFISMGHEVMLPNLALNSLLLGVLLTAVYLVSRLRKKPVKDIIGGGDIFFFVIAAFNFSPLMFNAFISVTAIVAIIIMLVRFLLQKNEQRLPYAGIMAFVLFVAVLLDKLTVFSTYNDQLIYQFIYA